ncbi:PSD1 and planctomycete cytochrome C domain-containing protein [Gimesia panareensis]|uniref:PSD1 and planctomycete cytochrome C domain-containing protein n=1 Tax=Gimesia panareensis TaxID=2527978 RepID=UPI00118A5952|nr:PSD1 and planctomycete cytochrome C domain-containing protein [Gimesia panareensis]QDU51952.1 Planctomycete cytochrome C [Gimesia panareensis]
MKQLPRIFFVCLILVGLTCFSTSAEEPAQQSAAQPKFSPEQLEFFEKSIRPLLAEHCYECHSGQAKRLEGGLRLDSRALILKGGDSGESIQLKTPHDSLLLEAVRYESFEMPPNTRLKQAQIDLLTRWVEMGLPWPDEKPPADNTQAEAFDLKQRRQQHWVWKSLEPVSPPSVQNQNWSDHPVDRFILASLEAKQLAPAQAADKRTLLRRLYFDLIGLPPTPAQIDEYLNDQSPQATEKVVDQLLASPHFGERWGRHWLDLMRYAESRGHEFDNDAPNAWQYRDYVIRALNSDLPYDQFVTEHIAGDLLPEPRLNPESGFNESVLATAFWFLGEWVHSPVDIRKDETDRFDNSIDVMTKSFLGMTVSCARCHDHKFDAISTRDYYALYGYLQSSNYHQVRFESMAHNRKIATQAEQLLQQQQTLLKARLKTAFQQEVKNFSRYYQSAAQQVQAKQTTDQEQQIQAQASEQQLNPGILQRWVEFLQNNKVAEQELKVAIMLEANQPASLAPPSPFGPVQSKTPDRTIVNYDNCPPEDFISDGFSFGLAPRHRGILLLKPTDNPIPLTVQLEGAAVRDSLWNDLEDIKTPQMNQKNRLRSYPRAGRTLRTPTFEVKGSVAYRVKGSCWVYACVDSHRLLFGPLHGSTLKKVQADKTGKPLWVFHDLSRYKGHRVHLEFTPIDQEPLEVYQVKHAAQGPEPDLTSVSLKNQQVQQAFTNAFKEFCDTPVKPSSQTVALINWVLAHPDLFSDPDSQERKALQQAIQDFQSQRDQLKQQIQNKSRTAMAIMDGSAENDHVLIRGSHQNPGPVVERRFLEALDGATPGVSGSGRLELAREINDPANPLTHRVIVNRIWAHLFGRGIVPSVDNFGVLGERPSHPELLDFLALKFLEQGRSIKQMIKYLVLSKTYQQASQTTLDVAEIDPDNILLYQMPLKRLEGEAIRDALLSISGRIDPTLYGPSIPVHLTKFMDGRGKPPVNGPLDGDGRRSIYIQVRRNFLSPMMLAYDTPSPFSTMGRRNVSNVPAQALIMMNDPFVIQQANLWGQHVAENPKFSTDQERTRWMYESALGRLPTQAELQAAEQFIQIRRTENPTAKPAEVWGELGHVIFNLKEFIYVF